jgi:tRNA threonylcarbamoyl adenosine modification protein YeaZ
MLVLGLDTSSPAVSAALVELSPAGGQVRAEHVVIDGRRHGELLAQGVRTVLGGVRPDAVVVGTGPGPFTGLRVGLMTAAALSDALGVPAYGVCSLDGVGVDDGVVVTDARRREVYWARYSGGERVEGPQVSRPAELATALVPGTLLAGAGAVLHREVFTCFEVDVHRLHPSASALVARAAVRVAAGAPSEPLTPLYLRRPDAVEPGAVKRVTAGGRAETTVGGRAETTAGGRAETTA